MLLKLQLLIASDSRNISYIRINNTTQGGGWKSYRQHEDMPLIYRITTAMAQQSGMSHRYSPEFIFAHKFTIHYDEFAQYLPEFGRLTANYPHYGKKSES